MNNTLEKEAVEQADPTTPAGVLVLKLQELGALTEEMQKLARKLSKKEKKEIDALEAQMEERIQTLFLGARTAEAEIKVDVIRQILSILKAK